LTPGALRIGNSEIPARDLRFGQSTASSPA